METGIHNTSEIGRLRKGLLHRPGQELENLMPEYLERLLFDDIPYLKEAQAEHDAFAQCLRDAGVEVVYLIDLVVNSLTSPEVRQELVTQFLKEADLPDEAAGKAVAEYLSELDDRAMVSAMMAGIRRSDLRKQGGRLSDHLSGLEEGYPFAVDPMPNLYFTRDPFATIGTGVSIHKMHTVTRNRETLFGRFIFEHNPWYQNAPRWYDRSASSSLEGGDILVLSPQVLAVRGIPSTNWLRRCSHKVRLSKKFWPSTFPRAAPSCIWIPCSPWWTGTSSPSIPTFSATSPCSSWSWVKISRCRSVRRPGGWRIFSRSTLGLVR